MLKKIHEFLIFYIYHQEVQFQFLFFTPSIENPIGIYLKTYI